jgi:tetratricopeptide (TPR) repeat protein
VEPEFTPFEQPDRFHLNAATGWLGLGDIASANDELDQITLAMQTHPIVLMARCQILMAAKNWEPLVEITGKLLKDYPTLHEAWVDRSYALHELKRTEEAFEALLPAVNLFPKVWVVPYNLACYCAQTEKLGEALEWLKMASEIAGERDIRAQALNDPDLKPIWNEITRGT